MNTAIVTGANGFIGKAVVKELLKGKTKVYAVVRKGTTNLGGLENTTIIECDMSDYSRLPSLINGTADVFYHFAWNGTSGPLRANHEIQLCNVEATVEAVKAASKLRVGTFVFASSIMAFEASALMKAGAELPLSTFYSISKMTADYFAKAVANSLKLRYISCVISNVFGPGEKSQRFINTVIRQLYHKEYVKFSSGEQLYDFIYITDAAKMLCLVGERGYNNNIYYIGNEKPQKLKNYIWQLRDIVAPDLQIGLGELPYNGISLTYNEFPTNKIRMDFGFVPLVSFEEGVRETLKYIIREGK